jgi:hypothetical protein
MIYTNIILMEIGRKRVLFITKGSASYRNASNLFLDLLISLYLLPLYDNQIIGFLPLLLLI